MVKLLERLPDADLCLLFLQLKTETQLNIEISGTNVVNIVRWTCDKVII